MADPKPPRFHNFHPPTICKTMPEPKCLHTLTGQSGNPKCHYIYAKQERSEGKNHEKAITTKHAIILLPGLDWTSQLWKDHTHSSVHIHMECH